MYWLQISAHSTVLHAQSSVMQIWVTAAKNGLRTGVFFWPGSEVPIQGGSFKLVLWMLSLFIPPQLSFSSPFFLLSSYSSSSSFSSPSFLPPFSLLLISHLSFLLFSSPSFLLFLLFYSSPLSYFLSSPNSLFPPLILSNTLLLSLSLQLQRRFLTHLLFQL